VPVGGGTTIELASQQLNPHGIAVDTTNVYWTNDNAGTVMTVPIGGGTPIQRASGQSNPGNIAVDATSVYWVNGNGGTVMKVAK
jgi:hypothetical protein